MLPITGDLGPTRTYSRRSYCWLPAVKGHIVHAAVLPDGEEVIERIPALGKLTLKVQHAKGCGCRCELDTYAVDEAEPEQPGTRLFVFVNLSDPTQEQPYRVTVGGLNRCRCMAGVCKAPCCKHADWAALAVAEGLLEPELLSV